MKSSPGPLSDDTVVELAVATLVNSMDLLNDAGTLLNKKRFARAYSLAILAAEEWGKHLMWRDVAYADPSDEKFWDRFWKDFQSHRPKFEKGAFISHFAGVASQVRESDDSSNYLQSRIKQLAQMGLDKKLRGFYVDIVNGKVVTPRHPDFMPSSDTIEREIGAITYQIVWGALTWLNPETPSVSAKASRAVANVFRDRFKNTIEQKYPTRDFNAMMNVVDQAVAKMEAAGPRMEALATKIREALKADVLPALERLTEGNPHLRKLAGLE